MENIMKEMNGNMPELNLESMENAAGGIPKSFPTEKRSARQNSETAGDIVKKIEEWGSGILERLGLKKKYVDNSIHDNGLPED